MASHVMSIETPEFEMAVAGLLAQLQPGDCVDYREYRLAKELHALPIGFDLWSYLFITGYGELMWAGWDPLEVKRSKSAEDVIAALQMAAERYPSLAGFTP